MPLPVSIILTFCELGAWALSVRRWVVESVKTDPIHYAVHFVKNPSVCYPFLLAAAVLTAVLCFHSRRKEVTRALLPLLLMGATLCLPASFGTLIVDLLIGGWALERLLKILPCRKIFPVRESTGVFIAGICGIALMLWAYAVQCKAFNTLFFSYRDWGEYAENYLLLADGKLPLKAFLARAGHFNLLPNLIMSGLFWLFRAPETLFAASAMLLGSLPILCYVLARSRRMVPGIGVVCAVLAALNPVIVNQSLSLFYGYHPILFMDPLLLLFFIFRARRSRKGMIAAFLLSLCVQETAAVFWFGYGFLLLCEKRWKLALPLMAGMLCWFFLLGRVVMPWALGSADYAQNFHYANLGNSFGEIVLAPLLRPQEFWGNLLQRQSLFFVLTLCLPVIPLLLSRWKKLAVVLPLLLGVLMQESGELKNPVMQYGFEITVFLLIAAIPETALPGKKLKRALAVSLFLTCCALFFWGRAPVGKCNARFIFKRPDCAPILDFIAAHLPEDGRAVMTGRLRTHWMFDRETMPLKQSFQVGDTVILDLNETQEACRAYREKLLADPRAEAVASRNWYGHQYMIWCILPEGAAHSPHPFIRTIGETEFSRIGVALPQKNPDFAVRLLRGADGTPLLLIRKRRKADYDLEIHFETFSQGKRSLEKICYGFGVHPAWFGSVGEVFIVNVPIPMPENCRVALIRSGR